jgi:lipopolysaccharide/colanic/teichoic acid biosynthesis glycosyltransferase
MKGRRRKRALDFIGALFLLVASAPLLLLCGGLVWLEDGRPILFRQERVGRGGVPFRIVKLRTMRAGPGPLITAAGDPRVRRIGRLLRRLKLDELPQLWNVLAGDMSLVGPRPEVPPYVEREPRLFAAILALRPGLTDWASLAFRDEEAILAARADPERFYRTVLLRRKVALARLYRRSASILLDLRLLVATGLMVIGAERLGTVLAGARLMARARTLERFAGSCLVPPPPRRLSASSLCASAPDRHQPAKPNQRACTVADVIQQEQGGEEDRDGTAGQPEDIQGGDQRDDTVSGE